VLVVLRTADGLLCQPGLPRFPHRAARTGAGGGEHGVSATDGGRVRRNRASSGGYARGGASPRGSPGGNGSASGCLSDAGLWGGCRGSVAAAAEPCAARGRDRGVVQDCFGLTA